jgi:hypothetical protein
MKFHSLNCLSICDYPIKRSGYEKKLRELGCDSVHHLSKLFELFQIPKAEFELIVIDKNIHAEMEPGFLMMMSELFPTGNIIMMEEDHEQLYLNRTPSKVIARLGKRAPVEEFDELVKLMLRNAKGSLLKTKKVEKEKAYQ